MFKKIDFLSPSITLFHFERKAHTSNIGACLFILLIVICLSYFIFLLYNLYVHNKMTFLFQKKFELEGSYFSFNSSSFFHFIQIITKGDIEGEYIDKLEPKYIRIFMTYSHSNLTINNLNLYDHWVFDSCRKDIDDKDLDSSLLENVENFTNGVCIRYYYNSLEKKYFSLDNEGFKWPYFENGDFKRTNKYLTTIIQKCSNNSIINEIFGNCPSQNEIDNYINKYSSLYLYFSDNEIDPNNFNNPITKHLQRMSIEIASSQIYNENYIYFTPVKIKTTIGSIFRENYEIDSFYFDFNSQKIGINPDENFLILAKYNHLMQNNIHIYERRYDDIFEIFAETGGLSHFIFCLFYCINYIYNQFIIDFDTNYLFFSLRDNNQKNRENNQIKITSISNKINISGNDNRIFNIQNNIVKLSGKAAKKARNSKFYVDKNNKKISKNNLQDFSYNIKPIIVNKEDTGSFGDENPNKNRRNLVKRQSTLYPKKSNGDNSKDILYNYNSKKNLELFDERRISPNSSRYHNATNISNNMDFIHNKAIKRIKKDILETNNNNKFINNKENVDNNITNEFNENIIANISISKNSLSQINYREKKLININNESEKKTKSFSFIYYAKSLFNKKFKENYLYLNLFRKHLLSEEHLLKSHINIVLLEKKYNINEDDKTNVFECFNEL